MKLHSERKWTKKHDSNDSLRLRTRSPWSPFGSPADLVNPESLVRLVRQLTLRLGVNQWALGATTHAHHWSAKASRLSVELQARRASSWNGPRAPREPARTGDDEAGAAVTAVAAAPAAADAAAAVQAHGKRLRGPSLGRTPDLARSRHREFPRAPPSPPENWFASPWRLLPWRKNRRRHPLRRRHPPFQSGRPGYTKRQSLGVLLRNRNRWMSHQSQSLCGARHRLPRSGPRQRRRASVCRSPSALLQRPGASHPLRGMSRPQGELLRCAALHPRHSEQPRRSRCPRLRLLCLPHFHPQRLFQQQPHLPRILSCLPQRMRRKPS